MSDITLAEVQAMQARAEKVRGFYATVGNRITFMAGSPAETVHGLALTDLPRLASAWSELHEEHEQLKAEAVTAQANIRILAAVVARLPKFEDGPPILPWSDVWTVIQNRDGLFIGLGEVRFYDSDEFADEDEKQTIGKGWYSTRESAKAALASAAAGGGT